MKTHVFLILSLVALSAAGCGGSRQTAPLPQPGGTVTVAEPEAEPEFEPYQPEQASEPASDPLAGVPPPGRELNRWVQTRLNERGYECGTPDGRVGPGTRRCIQAFRTDNDLSATSDIDDSLLTLLNAPR